MKIASDGPTIKSLAQSNGMQRVPEMPLEAHQIQLGANQITLGPLGFPQDPLRFPQEAIIFYSGPITSHHINNYWHPSYLIGSLSDSLKRP